MSADELESRMKKLVEETQTSCDECIREARLAGKIRDVMAVLFALPPLLDGCLSFYRLDYLTGLCWMFLAATASGWSWNLWNGLVVLKRKYKKVFAEQRDDAKRMLKDYQNYRAR